METLQITKQIKYEQPTLPGFQTISILNTDKIIDDILLEVSLRNKRDSKSFGKTLSKIIALIKEENDYPNNTSLRPLIKSLRIFGRKL